MIRTTKKNKTSNPKPSHPTPSAPPLPQSGTGHEAEKNSKNPVRVQRRAARVSPKLLRSGTQPSSQPLNPELTDATASEEDSESDDEDSESDESHPEEAVAREEGAEKLIKQNLQNEGKLVNGVLVSGNKEKTDGTKKQKPRTKGNNATDKKLAELPKNKPVGAK